jgi:serine/threonine-protein kinase
MLAILAVAGFLWMRYSGLNEAEPETQAATASQSESQESAADLQSSSQAGLMIDVPNLVGQNYADLESDLSSRKGDREYQLLLSSQQFSDTVPEGCILSQDPKPGAKMAKGTAIVVVVSEGAAVRTLPKVAGKTLSEASGAVTDAGFVPSKAEEPSDTVPEGRVIGYQDVKEGMGQAKDVAAMFSKAGLINIEMFRDLGGIERVVIGETVNQ